MSEGDVHHFLICWVWACMFVHVRVHGRGNDGRLQHGFVQNSCSPSMSCLYSQWGAWIASLSDLSRLNCLLHARTHMHTHLYGCRHTHLHKHTVADLFTGTCCRARFWPPYHLYTQSTRNRGWPTFHTQRTARTYCTVKTGIVHET